MSILFIYYTLFTTASSLLYQCGTDNCNKLFVFPETQNKIVNIRCYNAGECDNLVVYSGSQTNMNIYCTGPNSCDNIKVYCGHWDPPGNNYSITHLDGGDAICDIYCEADTSYACNNAFLSCKGSITSCGMWSNGGTPNIQSSTVECNIDTGGCRMSCSSGCSNGYLNCHGESTGYKCECNNGCPDVEITTSVTYNPTTSISSAPTTSISNTTTPTTNSPTTATPTTYIPTTATPITSAPTTATPITDKPTTNVPTTYIPTSITPTTSIPTTAAPITAVPITAVPTTAVPTTTAPITAAPITAPTFYPTVIPTLRENDGVVYDTSSTKQGDNNVNKEKGEDSIITVIIVMVVCVLILVIIISCIVLYIKKKKEKIICDVNNVAVNIELEKTKTGQMNIISETNETKEMEIDTNSSNTTNNQSSNVTYDNYIDDEELYVSGETNETPQHGNTLGEGDVAGNETNITPETPGHV